MSGAKAWYGLRGYNRAYSGPCCDVYSALDAANATLNIVDGALELATVGAGLPNNTTNICTIRTLYDQTGNGFDMTNATIANRPTLVVTTLGRGPAYMSGPSSGTGLASSTLGINNQPYSYSAVAFSKTNTEAPAVESTSWRWSGGTTTMILNAGSNSAAGTTAAATWNALQALFSGSSSVLRANGTETASLDPSTDSTIGAFTYGTDNILPARQLLVAEFGFWPTGFTAGNRSSIEINQRGYWGI